MNEQCHKEAPLAVNQVLWRKRERLVLISVYMLSGLFNRLKEMSQCVKLIQGDEYCLCMFVFIQETNAYPQWRFNYRITIEIEFAVWWIRYCACVVGEFYFELGETRMKTRRHHEVISSCSWPLLAISIDLQLTLFRNKLLDKCAECTQRAYKEFAHVLKNYFNTINVLADCYRLSSTITSSSHSWYSSKHNKDFNYSLTNMLTMVLATLVFRNNFQLDVFNKWY